MALYLNVWRDTKSWNFYHVYGAPVTRDDAGRVRWISYASFNPNCGLADLRVSCQGNSDRREEGVYAFEVEYREVYDIDARRLATMHKTLTAIERKMAKYDNEDGRCNSYGQYVLRAAKAMGCKGILWRSDADEKRSFDDCDWHVATLAEGMGIVDWWINSWMQDRETATA